MTALVYLKTPAAMHLMTDSACYFPDATVVGFAPKVAVLPDINMAIFTRGPAGAADIARDAWVGRFTSYDAFAANAVENVRAFYYSKEKALRATGQPDLEFYYFGYSKRHGCFEGRQIRCGFEDSAMHTDQDIGGAHIVRNPPFVEHELKVFGMAPGLFTKEDLAAATSPIHVKPSKWIPEIDMLQVLEMMRRKPEARFPGQPLRIYTGGHALLTTVTTSGITQKIVADFGDEIGRPIQQPAPVNWKRWREEALRRLLIGRMQERKAA